jgi:hypothetical protein
MIDWMQKIETNFAAIYRWINNTIQIYFAYLPLTLLKKMTDRRLTKQEAFDLLDDFISKNEPQGVYGVSGFDLREAKRIWKRMILPDAPPQYRIFSSGLDGIHCFSLYKSRELKTYMFAVTMQNPNKYVEITSESTFDLL